MKIIEVDNNSFKDEINNNTLLAKNYGILSIPCLILFKDGKEIKRNVGLLSQDEVIKFIGDSNV